MNISLYEMTNDLNEINELLAAEEMSEEMAQEIKDNIMDLVRYKSENIIKLTKNIETRIKSVKEEEKRLEEYRKSEEKRLNRLKTYVVDCLQTADLKKIDTSLGRISLRKSPASVQLIDETKIPSAYITTEVIHKINKTQIKKELQDGVNIEGVALVQDKYNLAIK